MDLFSPQRQEQQAIVCLDGDEDPDVGTDLWVPTCEMSGSSVRYLFPFRDGGWRELTGDVSKSEERGSGARAGISSRAGFRSTLQSMRRKVSLKRGNWSKCLTPLSSHVVSFHSGSGFTLLFWVYLVYLVTVPDLTISFPSR